MVKQNVTLSISKELLQQAKILAVERNTSLSALLTDALIEIVERANRYDVAKEQHLRVLNDAANLGSDGRLDWSRDALHER